MKKKSLNYILKGTEKAIKEVAQKWYADCFLDERDIQRLVSWENRIEIYLKDKDKKND